MFFSLKMGLLYSCLLLMTTILDSAPVQLSVGLKVLQVEMTSATRLFGSPVSHASEIMYQVTSMLAVRIKHLHSATRLFIDIWSG
jgi:hypothetical protein